MAAKHISDVRFESKADIEISANNYLPPQWCCYSAAAQLGHAPNPAHKDLMGVLRLDSSG